LWHKEETNEVLNREYLQAKEFAIKRQINIKMVLTKIIKN